MINNILLIGFKKLIKYAASAVMILTTVFFGSQAAKREVVIETSIDYDTDCFSWIPFDTQMTHTEDKVYFLAGTYLYSYNPATGESSVLCSRPDCLHEKETDLYKVPDCDAWFFLGNPSFLGSYDDKLIIAAENISSKNTELIEMNPDGSGRRVLISTLQNADHGNMCIHRGVLYYSTNSRGGNGEYGYTLLAMDLNGRGEAFTIYRSDNTYGAIQAILPLGEDIFFTDNTNTNSESMIGNEIICCYHTDIKETEIVADDGYRIYGASGNELILFRDKRYYAYSTEDHQINEIHRLNTFCENHADMVCLAEVISDDFAAFVCYKNLPDGSLVSDLLISDRNGKETAAIKNCAWALTPPSVMTIEEERYLFVYSESKNPYYIKAYKVNDLLKGIIRPFDILKGESYQDFLRGYMKKE